jgi:hypothetical protein
MTERSIGVRSFGRRDDDLVSASLSSDAAGAGDSLKSLRSMGAFWTDGTSPLVPPEELVPVPCAAGEEPDFGFSNTDDPPVVPGNVDRRGLSVVIGASIAIVGDWSSTGINSSLD